MKANGGIRGRNSFGTGFRPSKADAPLTVYSDAVWSGSIPIERFQPIKWKILMGMNNLIQRFSDPLIQALSFC